MGESTIVCKKNRKPRSTILFQPDLVRQILEGNKLQTRRIMDPQPVARQDGAGYRWWPPWAEQQLGGQRIPESQWRGETDPTQGGAAGIVELCPYGGPGNRLWIRESYVCQCGDSGRARLRYCADSAWATAPTQEDRHPGTTYGPGLRQTVPGIYAPRWTWRIQIEIVRVRVERVRWISKQDAGLEGFVSDVPFRGVEEFAKRWNEINRTLTWDLSPWVWVLDFYVVTTEGEGRDE